MQKIIINADDFGINQIVTNAIIECINQNLVSSTTIMANGECLSEVLAFSKSHPEISYGIHYCLSEFQSLTNSDVFKEYGLTDKNGVFIKFAIFNIKHIDHKLRAAIYAELCAQTDKLLSMGFNISHADSHHHVHTLPYLQNIFIDVLLKYNIKRVRIPSSRRFLSAIRHPLSYIKYKRVRNRYTSLFSTTGRFCSYMHFALEKRHSSPHDTTELMCHPGHPAKTYTDEINLLTSNGLSQFNKLKLISYLQL